MLQQQQQKKPKTHLCDLGNINLTSASKRLLGTQQSPWISMLDPCNRHATRVFRAAVTSHYCPKLETTSCPSKGRRVICDASCPWNTMQSEKEPETTSLNTCSTHTQHWRSQVQKRCCVIPFISRTAPSDLYSCICHGVTQADSTYYGSLGADYTSVFILW